MRNQPKKSDVHITIQGKPDTIHEYISLADKNWFATGGSTRYFCEPTSGIEFKEALLFAQTNFIETFILGNGANTLISDDGFDGLIIRPRLQHIAINRHKEHSILTAGSGVRLDDLIEYCLGNNLSGLEEFSGIPGTVGGAVCINLHYFDFFLSHFVTHAEVIHKKTGVIKQVDAAWFNFGYNQSTLLDEEYYLASASFKLKNVTDFEVAFARGRKKEIIRHRAARYPQTGTCGSFFRNFYPEEVSLEQQGKKIIYVAYYLDKIGVKGVLRCGNAQVSHQHANMIVNLGGATSTDIINVAKKMQSLVQEHFEIIPQPECRFIGFKDYPLIIKK